jgi:hypothetical protein
MTPHDTLALQRRRRREQAARRAKERQKAAEASAPDSGSNGNVDYGSGVLVGAARG